MQVHEITDWWKTKRPSSCEKSWNTWKDSHRITLTAAVAQIQASSVFELGCDAGQNLRVLREQYPGMKLGGCDIREDAAQWAEDHLGIPIERKALPYPVNNQWDAVLSCYTMSYLPADQVVMQIANLQPNYLILMEPWGRGETIYHLEEDVCPRWAHDWGTLMRAMGWVTEWRWPIEFRDYLDNLAVFKKLT